MSISLDQLCMVALSGFAMCGFWDLRLFMVELLVLVASSCCLWFVVYSVVVFQWFTCFVVLLFGLLVVNPLVVYCLGS